MRVIIRTHIKNKKRLKLLENSIRSVQSKGFKDVVIVDNLSPMQKEVEALCNECKVSKYVRTGGKPDTKDGFYFSLKEMGNEPCILAVDDFVCGQNIEKEIKRIQEEDIPKIESNYGCIGTFACYPFNIRNFYKDTHLWNINIEALYALVFHIISPKLKDIMIKEWEEILEGKREYPLMCDDLWLATVCKREGLLAFNTRVDYVQHTGMRNRSFGDNVHDSNSDYVSPAFVGI